MSTCAKMESEEVNNKGWRQYLVAVSACLGMICGGTLIGWMSPTMKLLLSKESPIKMTYDQLAWTVSTITATSSIVPVACAYLLDTIGRKRLLIIAAVFYTLSWLCIASWQSLPSLFISKIFGGLGMGISMTCTAVYIGEIAETRTRGSMGVLTTLSFSLGVVFESIVGPRVSFRTLNIVSMVFPVLFLLTFTWMPESPYYLTLKNMPEKAASSLMWLRGRDMDQQLEREMENIREYTKTKKLSFTETIRAILTKKYSRALMLTLVLGFGRSFSGLMPIASYTESIFSQIDSPINPPDAVILLNFLTAFFIFVSMFVVDKIGRRKLLLFSLVGTSTCHFLIATYLILSKLEIIDKGLSWIALVGLFGFNFFFAFGISSIPFIILGEIFPGETKAWCLCINSLYDAVLAFILTKMYQVIDEGLGAYVSFYIFSASMFLTALYVLFFMPETKNKTFIEILEIFEGRSKKGGK